MRSGYMLRYFEIEQVKKIDRHEGFVKGITWDPAGKYLASQVHTKKEKKKATASKQ